MYARNARFSWYGREAAGEFGQLGQGRVGERVVGERGVHQRDPRRRARHRLVPDSAPSVPADQRAQRRPERRLPLQRGGPGLQQPVRDRELAGERGIVQHRSGEAWRVAGRGQRGHQLGRRVEHPVRPTVGGSRHPRVHLVGFDDHDAAGRRAVPSAPVGERLGAGLDHADRVPLVGVPGELVVDVLGPEQVGVRQLLDPPQRCLLCPRHSSSLPPRGDTHPNLLA